MRRFAELYGARRGFTLTELAIVMGVVGIIISGAWSAASAVHNRRMLESTVSAINETAMNIRDLYTGHAISSYPSGQTQVCAGMFSQIFLQGTGTYDCNTWTPKNAWGGSVALGFSNGTSSPRGVTVGIVGSGSTDNTLRSEVCLALLEHIPASDSRTGYGGGVSVTNGVPLPASLPTYNPAQGGIPTNSYVSTSSGSWVEATGLTPSGIQALIGQSSCYGVAFFYEF